MINIFQLIESIPEHAIGRFYCIETNSCWIFHSNKFMETMSKYITLLKNNDHPIQQLQQDYNNGHHIEVEILQSLGEDSLSIKVIESYYIDHFREVSNMVYNRPGIKLKSKIISTKDYHDVVLFNTRYSYYFMGRFRYFDEAILFQTTYFSNIKALVTANNTLTKNYLTKQWECVNINKTF